LEEQNSPYVMHKLAMEEIIKKNCPTYNIFRVSNVVGFTTNTTTIFSYLVNNIKNKIPFQLWVKAHRNILGIDEIAKIVIYIIKNKEYINKVINIANTQNYSVGYLVSEIESFFQIAANYELLNKGNLFDIDITIIEHLFPKLNIHITNQYINQLLHKYYI
jgi:nucleoside-diphosphate-sugar epimerase